MIRIVLASVFGFVAGAAQAQVMEVGDDGAVHWLGARQDEAAFADAPMDAPAADTMLSNMAFSNAMLPAAIPSQYRAAVHAAARRHDLSPWLIDAVARAESGYDAAAVSPVGAIGIMQLMPDTAHELGVDPRDPVQNIDGGAAYLRKMLDRFDGNIDLALAAYNAGSGRVVQYGGVPPFRETRDYVRRNLERLAAAANDKAASYATAGAVASNTTASSTSPTSGGAP
ncbi:MAG: lytic transglycosylase domain-containing protein [Pseudoxanthomonas sp.]